jgi:uncharacterized protein
MSSRTLIEGTKMSATKIPAAASGYASLLVESRGTGASPGLPRAPFDPDEGRDGAAVVEWAASQPWCDGGVGMWGVSYAETTALRTASLRPPGLKAIAAVMGMLDPERDFIHPEGHRGCLASLGMWGLSTLAQHLTPPLRADPTGALEGRWRARLERGRPFLLEPARAGAGASGLARARRGRRSHHDPHAVCGGLAGPQLRRHRARLRSSSGGRRS